MRGYSFFGFSFVYIIFEDGTDLYWARSRVLEYLSYVGGQLPRASHRVSAPTRPASAGSTSIRSTVATIRLNIREDSTTTRTRTAGMRHAKRRRNQCDHIAACSGLPWAGQLPHLWQATGPRETGLG